MAGNITQKFGTAGQTISCTLASLATGSAQQSAAIDNTANLFQDALVQVKVKTGASGVTTTGTINVYAVATVDGGTTYSEGASGSNAAITLTAPPNAVLIGVINAVANATPYVGGPWSVASKFGGILPAFWAIVIENKTGGTLDSTEGNHAKLYQGVYSQYT